MELWQLRELDVEWLHPRLEPFVSSFLAPGALGSVRLRY